MNTESVCGCYCHVASGATCTVDHGYGVPGVPYCGPHTTGPLCVLEHGWTPEGHPRYIEARVGLLCGRHRSGLDDVSLEIELLVIDLLHCREAGTTPRSDNESARHEHRKLADDKPVPINLDYLVLVDRRSGGERDHGITVEEPIGLAKLLGRYLDMAGLSGAPGRILGALETLRRHHDHVAEQGWVGDYIADLAGVRQVLRAAVNDRMFRRVGTCDLPAEADRPCGGPLLVENGSGYVRCGRCKARWTTPEELARLAVRLA